jgi:hypothetical protein
MQLSLRLGLSATLVASLSACGGASAPKPVSPPAQAAAPTVALAPAPDLSPVSTPAGLILVGRVARPGELAKQLAGWVSLPFEPGMVDAIEPGLSQAVAFDAPVDFAMVVPEGEPSTKRTKPEVVISVGLTSTEKARVLLEKRIGQKLIDRGKGIYVTPEDGEYHCAIAPSLGKAPARCVCSDSAGSLDELLAYATRGLPLQNLGISDLHAELRFEPLRHKYGSALRMGRTMGVPAILRELSLSDARFDRPLSDVAHALGDELIALFEDLDHVDMDLRTVAKPEELELKLTVAYRGQTSFISQSAADAQHRMLPPSAQFYDLPADASTAAFMVGPDPKRLQTQRALVTGLIEGLLAHLEVGAPLRRDVRAAVETLFDSASPVVGAYGPAPSVLATNKATPFIPEGIASIFGWSVYGVEAPAGPYKDALKTVVRLGSDKAFRQGLERLASSADGGDEQSKPGKGGKSGKTAKSNAAAGKRSSEWMKLSTKAIAGMPVGSEVMLIEFNQDATKRLLAEARRQASKGKKLDQLDVEALRYLVAVVPDGGRTWLVVAMDDRLLVDRAKAVVASGMAPRLSTRSDISALKGQPAYSAGYVSLLVAKGLLQALLLGEGKSIREADSLLSTLPHHGTTPMSYRTIMTGDEKGHRAEFSITVPRAIFDDAAAAVPSLMMSFPN